MPRPRTAHVQSVRQKLIARTRDGLHRPGDRFMSNRAIAEQFAISYQTADRLIRELVAAGHLVRHPRSGTFLPGSRTTLTGAQLILHGRCRRPGSFGQRLLRHLTAALDAARIPWLLSTTTDTSRPRLSRDHYPVIWESPQTLSMCVDLNRPALLLNDRPAPGLASLFVDSLSTDDFNGGAIAAQLLTRPSRDPTGRRSPSHAGLPNHETNALDPNDFAILAGPLDDPRSQARVAGFRSVLPAAVISAESWFYEEGLLAAPRVLAAGPRGIFCCNDRLAEAIIQHCRTFARPLPPLVGFDDAPVADRLDLTTIAIPWPELTTAAVDVIRHRLATPTTTARHQTFTPRPIIRH